MSVAVNFGAMQSAIDEMGQVSSQIESELSSMIAQCTSAASHLQGAHADAYSAFQQKVQTLEGQMQLDLTQGQQALDEMKQLHQSSDNQGAQYLGG